MKAFIMLTLLATAFPALAHRLPMPADTPASFTAECSSCHVAYPPALLPASDWRKLMTGLGEHFGSDAAIDRDKAREISAFLERNGGNAKRLGNAGNPPRITKTAHFIRHHHEIPGRFWRDPRVKSAANCEACHRGAAQGDFNEHDIAIPELRE